MGLRDRLRRLQRAYEKEHAIHIPQEDGTVARFYKKDLADAFLSAHYRVIGRDVPDHPLCQACRRSSDPKWRESVFSAGETVSEGVPDLSEP
jgi:hypothetical protein